MVDVYLTWITTLGTYWYHSHLALQYCDGLRGPLIVYDPHDPNAYLYDVDDGKYCCLSPGAMKVQLTPDRVYCHHSRRLVPRTSK